FKSPLAHSHVVSETRNHVFADLADRFHLSLVDDREAHCGVVAEDLGLLSQHRANRPRKEM
ncbi:MAG: hypothetical protein WCK14_13260, partial [Actinomycetota bacterium]